MNNLDMVKLGVRTITQMGTGKIIYSIVNYHVPVITNFDKVKVTVGTFMLAGTVAKPVADHSEEFVDEVVEGYNTVKKFIEEHQSAES